MGVTVISQVYVFIGAFVCGLIVGFIYDIFRVFRKIVKSGIKYIGVQDMFFWVVAASVVFIYIFTMNDGELRWYEFFGIAIGTLSYGVLLSRFARKILLRCYGIINNVAALILKIVLTPIALIYRLLRRPFVLVVDVSRKNFRRVGRGIAHKSAGVTKTFSYFFKNVKKI